jgi:hypothetical protein
VRTLPGIALCCAALVAGATCCLGQGIDVVDTSSIMKATISMDRDVYLPGEVAQVTLTITNPDSRPVLSRTPFIKATTCLEATVKGKVPRVDETCGAGDRPMTIFAPGEIKRLVLNSFDNVFDSNDWPLGSQGARAMPGDYTLTVQYGSAPAAGVEYRVAPTTLEADQVVRVHDGNVVDPLGQPVTVPNYVHVLALRSEGVSYICVQQGTAEREERVSRIAITPDKVNFDDATVSVPLAVPFKRVATSAAPIVTLSATADGQENLTIDWTDANGGIGHLFYPASYPARPVSRNQ